MKILLITASFGDGHHQVADALSEAFLSLGAETCITDLFRAGNQRMARFNESLYSVLTRYFPSVYGLSYNLTKHIRMRFFWRLLSGSSRRAARRIISEIQPDAVVQLFPDHALAYLAGAKKRPFVGVVLTDFSVHARWFHPGAEVVYIPNELLSLEVQRFVDANVQVVPKGIPVRAQFTEHHVSPAIHHPYILFATGGRGLFPQLSPILRALSESLPAYHLYVMCGRNQQMLSMVDEVRQGHPRVHGLPFVKNVSAWLQSAHFAVVKPGGVTLAEAMAAECPLILYRPAPGQEGDNAAFLSRAGAAKIANTPVELIAHAQAMAAQGPRAQMAYACRQVKQPHAAELIAQHVLQQIPKNSTQA